MTRQEEKLKTLKLENSKTKNVQNSQKQRTPPPPPPPPPLPPHLCTPKKENEDPQNDKKKIEDPQTLKKQKIPQSSQNEFVF
jgi:hypothetical protein